jgi:hypothetical protein
MCPSKKLRHSLTQRLAPVSLNFYLRRFCGLNLLANKRQMAAKAISKASQMPSKHRPNRNTPLPLQNLRQKASRQPQSPNMAR